jgi:hypothetical protein
LGQPRLVFEPQWALSKGWDCSGLVSPNPTGFPTKQWRNQGASRGRSQTRGYTGYALWTSSLPRLSCVASHSHHTGMTRFASRRSVVSRFCRRGRAGSPAPSRSSDAAEAQRRSKPSARGPAACSCSAALASLSSATVLSRVQTPPRPRHPRHRRQELIGTAPHQYVYLFAPLYQFAGSATATKPNKASRCKLSLQDAHQGGQPCGLL